MNAASRKNPRATLASAVAMLIAAAAPGRAAAPGGRYGITTDTVTDGATGLVWQRSADASPHAWADALAYCDALELGGSPDWRLPSIKELLSLFDVRAPTPGLDTTAFPDAPTLGILWSSTPYAGSVALAWTLYPPYGAIHTSKTEPYLVRCVR